MPDHFNPKADRLYLPERSIQRIALAATPAGSILYRCPIRMTLSPICRLTLDSQAAITNIAQLRPSISELDHLIEWYGNKSGKYGHLLLGRSLRKDHAVNLPKSGSVFFHHGAGHASGAVSKECDSVKLGQSNCLLLRIASWRVKSLGGRHDPNTILWMLCSSAFSRCRNIRGRCSIRQPSFSAPSCSSERRQSDDMECRQLAARDSGYTATTRPDSELKQRYAAAYYGCMEASSRGAIGSICIWSAAPALLRS